MGRDSEFLSRCKNGVHSVHHKQIREALRRSQGTEASYRSFKAKRERSSRYSMRSPVPYSSGRPCSLLPQVPYPRSSSLLRLPQLITQLVWISLEVRDEGELPRLSLNLDNDVIVKLVKLNDPIDNIHPIINFLSVSGTAKRTLKPSKLDFPLSPSLPAFP